MAQPAPVAVHRISLGFDVGHPTGCWFEYRLIRRGCFNDRTAAEKKSIVIADGGLYLANGVTGFIQLRAIRLVCRNRLRVAVAGTGGLPVDIPRQRVAAPETFSFRTAGAGRPISV